MSEGILVFCEMGDGAFKKTAFELLGKASELVGQAGGVVSAVVLGPDGIDFGVLGGYGATKVYHASIDANNAGEATRALQKALDESGAKIVFASASAQAKEIFPRLSARLRAGLGAEVTELSFVDGQIVGKRPQFAGKVFSEVRISSEKQLFTIRGGSFVAPEAGSGSAVVQSLDVDFEELDSSAKVVEILKSEAAVVDLTEADRIVSGGRSVKSKESFDSLIRPLSVALGATPGASRAAVDAGYAGHSEQVGQTGKIVNPSLYIACGISGAIQHLAGMRTSRVIVSINKDKEAPIFKHSTYGIVADMFDVIPVLTKALTGGEIPVIATPIESESSVTEETEETKETKETKAPDVTKKTSLKDRLAAKKAAVASATDSTPTEAKTASTTSSTAPASISAISPIAQGGATVNVGIDPAAMKELKDEITALKKGLEQIKSGLDKTVKDGNVELKKELQRSEGNAKSFQENAFKKMETIDKTTANEVRRIREKTREAISNDTGRLQEALFVLKGSVTATLVLNILTLILVFIMMMKTF